MSRVGVSRVRVSRARGRVSPWAYVRVRARVRVRGGPYAAHVSVMAVSGARVTTMPSFLLSNMLSM